MTEMIDNRDYRGPAFMTDEQKLQTGKRLAELAEEEAQQ